MSFTISTTANYHWVRKIIASTHGNGVLKLTLLGEQDPESVQFNTVEINVFTDDVEMTEHLISAINAVAPSEKKVAA